MKHSLRSIILLFAMLAFGAAKAQVCVVDPQYTSPGIYPSDTLQQMFVGAPTNQVIQFVFPSDTFIFGQTIPFDSFKVNSVQFIPPGLQWECNLFHPICTYYTTPGLLTRGCVKLFGTPTTQSPTFPAYDSLIVSGTAYLTFFGQPFPITQNIAIYNLVEGGGSTNSPFEGTLDMALRPNPSVGRAALNFNLVEAAEATYSIVNLVGEVLETKDLGLLLSGQKTLEINTSGFASGIYFIRLDLNQGGFTATEKIAVMR